MCSSLTREIFTCLFETFSLCQIEVIFAHTMKRFRISRRVAEHGNGQIFQLLGNGHKTILGRSVVRLRLRLLSQVSDELNAYVLRLLAIRQRLRNFILQLVELTDVGDHQFLVIKTSAEIQ